MMNHIYIFDDIENEIADDNKRNKPDAKIKLTSVIYYINIDVK